MTNIFLQSVEDVYDKAASLVDMAPGLAEKSK